MKWHFILEMLWENKYLDLAHMCAVYWQEAACFLTEDIRGLRQSAS